MNNNDVTQSLYMDQYMENLILSEDDPGLLVSWNFDGLEEFARIANTTNGLPNPDVPITNIGAVTCVSIMKDIVAYIRLAAGLRFFQPFEKSDILFAPNSLIEFTQVLSQLKEFICDPWVKAIIRNSQPLLKLGHLAVIKCRTMATAIPLNLSSNSVTCPFSYH